MERIKQIWKQLESVPCSKPGIAKIRYSDASKCDLYLGLRTPENYRLLAVRVPLAAGTEFNFRYELRGLKFEKAYDSDNSDFILLNLILVEEQFKDIFDAIVFDITSNLLVISEVKYLLKEFSNRLIKWQSIFERFNPVGLTSEQQRGLYGELFFLRKFLQTNSDLANVINSWVGSEKQIRDFQSGTWSVEVKTTHGNNHQKVHISSERQLDTSNIENLFLYHISLEVRQQSGETLNQIIDSILGILIDDFAALNNFKNKLLQACFFEYHRHLYESIGYFIRQEIFYKIEKEFPRIEEKDIRNGVGDVKYSIILSQCSAFIKSEQEIFKTTTI